MKFDFNILWVLHSVFHTEKKSKGATVSTIISYADYTNHAVITYEELLHGLTFLSEAGLILQNGNGFQTSRKYKLWWSREFRGKKIVRIDVEHKSMQKYLEENFEDRKPNRSSSIVLSESDFNLARQQYLETMKGLPD